MAPSTTEPIRILLIPLFLAMASWTWAAGTITFSADSVVSRFEKNNESTELQGNVRLETGSLVIQAAKVDIIGSSQRYLRASGQVSVLDSERNLTIQGQSLFYDRELETVRVQGNVILEDFTNEVVMRATSFEFHMDDNLAIFNGNVRLYKNTMKAKSEFATYQRDSSLLELNGFPEVTKDNDTYQARMIRVNTKTDDIQLLGNVSGSVQSQGGTNE